MADKTIINNPNASSDGSGGAAGWIAAVVIILILVIGAIYLFPRLRGGSGGGTNINVQLPAGGGTPAAGGTSGGTGY